MSLTPTALDARISLRGLLGRGGMGEVHRAWDTALERAVAVKFVKGGDAREAERLLLEARLQARIDHPHVVRVHDTGTLEGRPCIVLQLVEGRTFAELAPDPEWRPKVALAAQAARGLGAAHRMGLVHRDVKPANILVEATGEGPQARLSDFGLARDEEGGLTRSGLLVGTVDYMAPEQVTGLAPVDFRADIYGLGATLHAVLTGRPPFRGSQNPTVPAPEPGGTQDPTEAADAHPGDLLRRILEEAPPNLAALRPDLPRDLAVVVAKALEKEPIQRYATAEAFAEDLERVLRGEPPLARPLGGLERGLRWMRRNPVAARALAASLAVMVGAGGFAAWRSRTSTLEALEAARLGGEAKALELRLRMAHLAPAHDLRPVLADLRAGLQRLANRRGAAGAAADYARGRVFLLLEELEAARTALESAQRLGYRGPELDEALGFTYGRLYQRARPEVMGISEEGLRRERLEVIQRELRAPALRHLAAAGNSPYHQAFSAWVEGDFERARSLARQAFQADPERSEALRLEAEAWAAEALEASDEVRRDRARVCVVEGLKVAGRLRDLLRSDPQARVLLARLRNVESGVALSLGQDMQPPFRAGLALTDEALQLDAGNPEIWQVRSKLLEDACQVATNLGTTDGIHWGTRQVEAARTAVSLSPGRAAYLVNLSTALYSLGHAKSLQGQDPVADHQEGRKVAAEAARLEPWDPRAPHLGILNALDEARFRITHGQDATECLTAAQGLATRLEGMRGISPKLLRPCLADLRSMQAQDTWNRGGDPDPLQQEAQAQYEAMFAEDPGRFNRTSDIGYGAVIWAQSRVARGQSVTEVLKRAEPTLTAGLQRWPKQPLLHYYVAWLKAMQLFDHPGGSSLARDPSQAREALAAYDRAFKVMANPGVREIRAWIHLARAEAGVGGAATLACADFEDVVRRDPGSKDPQLGWARALRLRGRPGDLERAWEVLERMEGGAKADPEAQLTQALILADRGKAEAAATLRAGALARQPLLKGHPVMALPRVGDLR